MKRMDHTRTSGAGAAGVSELPAAACSETAIRGDGDVRAAEPGGCFDCNICLDPAADPVVTLCGHLYCWPCIYEWLRPEPHDDAESMSSARQQCCPVCKAAVTPDALVPLYGRGSRARPTTTKAPRRPALRQSAQESGDRHHHRYRNVQTGRPATPGPRHHAGAAEFDLLFPPPFGDRGGMTMQYSSTAGGLAMAALLPWARRRDRGQPSPSTYFPSPYRLSPSQRRRQMEVETSLRHIWSFLLAIALLCFLLF